MYDVLEYCSAREKLEMFMEECITNSLAQKDHVSLRISAYNQSDQTDLESDLDQLLSELVRGMYLFDVVLFCTKYDECFMPSFCRVVVSELQLCPRFEMIAADKVVQTVA